MTKKTAPFILCILILSLSLGVLACGTNQTPPETSPEEPLSQPSTPEKTYLQESGAPSAAQTIQAQTEGDTAQAQDTRPETEPGPAPSDSEPAGNDSGESRKNVLVVYFSATGATKGVAEKIAKLTGGDLCEIVPATPYSSDDLNYNDSQSRTSIETNDPDIRPEIAGDPFSLEGYSTLYLGYPIWWGQAPRILSTFAESYDFNGLTVIPFCTSGSSDIGDSGEQLAEQAGSGVWLSGLRFNGSVTESDLRDRIDGIQ
jgi:flavodoxin